MEPMSYENARTVIARYNKSRLIREIAREMRLPYDSCFDLIDWLWNRTFVAHEDFIKKLPGNQAGLPELSERVWIEYLYSRNCTPEAAAVSVGWHVNEVLRTCKGPSQWRRSQDRLPVRRAPIVRADGGPTEEEMPEEEIYQRALEIRMQRPETQQESKPGRVEVQRCGFVR